MKDNLGLEKLDNGGVRYPGGASLFSKDGKTTRFFLVDKGGIFKSGDILSNPHDLSDVVLLVVEVGVGKPLVVEEKK